MLTECAEPRWFKMLDAPGKIINQDVANKITKAAAKNTVPASLSKLSDVIKAQSRLGANTNLRLAMECLLIRIAQR